LKFIQICTVSAAYPHLNRISVNQEYLSYSSFFIELDYGK